MIEKTASVSLIARLLMLTTRRVQQLADEGIIPRVGRGKYPLVGCVNSYIQVLKQTTHGDKAAADARLKSAQADLREMEYATKRGELLPRDLMESTLVDALVMMNQQLEAIGGRLAMELAGITDAALIRSKLLNESREIRQGIADGFGRLISDIEKRAGQN